MRSSPWRRSIAAVRARRLPRIVRAVNRAGLSRGVPALLVAAVLPLLGSCGKPPAPPPPAADAAPAPPAAPPPPRVFTIERKCMGTKCQVKAFHADEALVERAVSAGLAEMDRIEALTTSWTDTSDVARVNRAAGKEAVKVAPDTMAVVKQGLWVAKLSHGAFDITVGVFKGLWKFDEDNDQSIPDFN